MNAAIIDGPYRYLLTRTVGGGRGAVVFIMLNPSTADAETDDPTIRRCIAFARRWGYAELRVVNLFALRATNPRRLAEAEDPIGPENRKYVAGEWLAADCAVAAWGATKVRGWDDYIWDMALQLQSKCCHLGLSRNGSPRHPLYLDAETRLQKWVPY